MLEVKNSLEYQLSSPPSSYKFECDPPHIYVASKKAEDGSVPQQQTSNAERLKVRVPLVSLTIFFDVPGLQSSKARFGALEAAEASRAEISHDWEIKTRIARGASFPMYLIDHFMLTNVPGLHTAYLPSIPKSVHSRLKAAGHGFRMSIIFRIEKCLIFV